MHGHNGNADNEIGFGVKESKMIRQVLDVVKGEKIVLVGCSMGGASVWMASDHPRVAGIVSESAYSRLRPTTVTWLSRFGSWGPVVWAPVIKLCEWRTNINPDDVNPIEFAEKWDRSKPALVIHAGEDKLIPKSQGEELAKASGADYWEVPSASHANCQFQREEYVNRLDAIMKRL
jgi:pimeloyl-ACP methyl ester carboxylesterase